jgi:hypothetical protein
VHTQGTMYPGSQTYQRFAGQIFLIRHGRLLLKVFAQFQLPATPTHNEICFALPCTMISLYKPTAGKFYKISKNAIGNSVYHIME